MLSIKEVENKTGLTSHTLRYYEKEGLIIPERLDSGYRIFNEDDVEWLMFIKKLRDADISIEEIRAYATLYHQGDAGVEERLNLMQQYLEETKKKIKMLLDIEKTMSKQVQYDKKILKMVIKQKR